MANIVIGHNPIDPKDCTKYHTSDGITVTEWLDGRKFLHPTICYANGFEEDAILLLAEQHDYVLRSTDTIVFVPQLQGGGGSNPLKVVLGLALIVFSGGIAGFAAGTLGATAITGAMVAKFGAAILLSAFAKPKVPESGGGDIKASSPTYSVQAQGNLSALGSVIPKIYGTHIMYPSFIAAPWVKYINNEQYLCQIFLIGHGTYDLVEPKLEDSPISSFTRCDWAYLQYDDSGVQTIPLANSGLGWSAWQDAGHHQVVTSQEVSGQELVGNNEPNYDFVGAFVVNPSGTEINALEFDLICPRGLYYANDDGSFASRTVGWEFWAQKIDDDGEAVGEFFAVTSPQTVAGSSSVERQIPYADGVEYVQVAFVMDLGVKNTTNIQYTTNSESDWINGNSSNEYAARYISHTLDTSGTTDVLTAVVEGVWGYTLNSVVWCGGVKFTFDYSYTTTSSSPTMTAATNEVQQWTYSCVVAPGRYQVKGKRTDAKDTNTRAGHELRWAGLKGRITRVADYSGLTLLYTLFAATDQLSQQASRKVNCVVKSKHRPQVQNILWDDYGTPQDAMVDVITAYYGGRLPENIIDANELSAQKDASMLRGDYFNYVADQRSTLWDALTLIGRSCRTVPSIVNGKLYFIRDEPRPTPIAVFSNNNIIKGSFKIDRIMPGERTSAWIEAEYFSSKTWTWKKELVGLKPPDPTVLPLQVRFEGITNRAHLIREATYQAAANTYRRQFVTFSTEMDGFIPTFGDAITVSHDLPNWGQHGLVTDYTINTVTSNVLWEWSDTGDNICAFRMTDGSLSDEYNVTRGADDSEMVFFDPVPAGLMRFGIDQSPTQILFGTADTWAKKCIVLAVHPRGFESVELSAVLENEIVHSADAFTSGLQTGEGVLIVPAGCTQASVSISPASWGTTAMNVVYGQPPGGFGEEQCWLSYPFGSGGGMPTPYYSGGAESTEFGTVFVDSFSISLSPVNYPSEIQGNSVTTVILGLSQGQAIHYRVGRGGDGADWENHSPVNCPDVIGIDGSDGLSGRLVVVFS